MREPIYYIVFQDKTVFMPFKHIYSECFLHIKDKPQLIPLKCFLTDSCPVGANCGEVLARRVHYLFENVFPPTAEMLIAYYKYPDRPKSIRAGIFTKQLDDVELKTLNPYAFKKFQSEGDTYSWVPRDEYLFMGGNKELVTISQKVKL